MLIQRKCYLLSNMYCGQFWFNSTKYCLNKLRVSYNKGPAIRNDIVNDFVDDARADAIFATLKSIVDDIVTCGMALTAAEGYWDYL